MTQQQFGVRRIVISLGAVCALALPAVALASAPGETSPVPPGVEAAPVAGPGGQYCFSGPHPADHAGSAEIEWDATQGNHFHPYPPQDLRLYALKDGCYYFVGDPTDFGYRGESYQYYGAHPVHAHYGGGWCFMIGGHAHWWRPWSPYFVVAGPWYYWHGPYDPFFWTYWPYYSVYYHHYYPRYYRGGRYWRRGWDGHAGRGWRRGEVAPAIGRVPSPPVTPTAAVPVGSTRAFGRNDGWNSTSPGRTVAPVTGAPSAWSDSWSTRQPREGRETFVPSRPSSAPFGSASGAGRAGGYERAVPTPAWGNSNRATSIPFSAPSRVAPSSGSWNNNVLRGTSGGWGGGGGGARGFPSPRGPTVVPARPR